MSRTKSLKQVEQELVEAIDAETADAETPEVETPEPAPAEVPASTRTVGNLGIVVESY